MTKNLELMPYAQAHITICGNIKKLVSYVTDVVLINTDTGWTQCTGTYSNTTRKHISAFCKEIGCGMDYQLMKKLYADEMEYNIYTGEVRAIA